MEKDSVIKFNVTSKDKERLKEISDKLLVRGWKKRPSQIRNLLLTELLSNLTPEMEQKFITKYTPIEFLLSNALKNPKTKIKIEKLLKEESKKRGLNDFK